MSSDPTVRTEIAVNESDDDRRGVVGVNEWDRCVATVRHGFDLNTDSGKANYLACLTGGDEQLQESYDKEITVVGWMLHVVNRADEETGELVTGLRLVLLTSDGKRLAGGSGVLIDNWAHVVAIYGQHGVLPPIRVVIQRVKRAKGMGYYLSIKSIALTKTPAKK